MKRNSVSAMSEGSAESAEEARDEGAEGEEDGVDEGALFGCLSGGGNVAAPFVDFLFVCLF